MKISCPKCGSNAVSFSILNQKGQCEYCGESISIEEIESYDINDAQDKCEYVCSSCGAQLIGNENDIIYNCIYCGGKEIIKKDLKGAIKIDGIIPFAFNKESMISAWKEKMKQAMFLPSKFEKDERLEDVKGIYIPCYIAEYDVIQNYRGKVNETITGESFDKVMIYILILAITWTRTLSLR